MEISVNFEVGKRNLDKICRNLKIEILKNLKNFEKNIRQTCGKI